MRERARERPAENTEQLKRKRDVDADIDAEITRTHILNRKPEQFFRCALSLCRKLLAYVIFVSETMTVKCLEISYKYSLERFFSECETL